MDKDMKIRDNEDIIMTNSTTKATAIQILRFEDLKGSDVPKAPIYVLKTADDGANYLAELHLVHNEYGLIENLCFIFKELPEAYQKKYEDDSIMVMAKYADVRKYKPKSKTKKK